MKRLLSVFLIIALLAGAAGCADGEDSDGRLSVYTSFYPMYYFAAAIGGEKAAVHNMVSPGEDAHSYELTPKQMAGLGKADIFIYNGAGFEAWAETALNSISNKKFTVVKAADAVTLIDAEGHGHDEHDDEDEEHDGHDHGEYDPHIWLSPLNAKLILKQIADAFAAKDAENAEYYQNNYAEYAAKLDALHAEYKQGLSDKVIDKIVVSHRSFGYLCHEYGLEQISIQNISKDDDATGQTIPNIVGQIKKFEIKVIFYEEFGTEANAKAIKAELDKDKYDVTLAVLSPIENLTKSQSAAGLDYLSVMRQNLEALKAALK